MSLRAILLAGLLALPAAAAEVEVVPLPVPETKALFGRIESRFVVPARSRIGGTLTVLEVTEGSTVEAGQVVARIVDAKLESQAAAMEARIAAARAQLQNAETELARVEELLARGTTTVQRADQARTQADVARNAVAEAEAALAVIRQSQGEGAVLAPAAGRVLTVPGRLGEVVMPGEPVATIAGGGVFLRLAIPERHAADLREGSTVEVEGGTGRIEKLYPQIENGRVIVDVAVEGLSDAFIGQRVLVRVPVALREVLAVPEAAIVTVSGLDRVRLALPGGGEAEVTVVPGRIVQSADGPRREILSGLRAGDRVIVP